MAYPDPILCANYVECACGSRSWPVEAGWVGDDLLLVTFDPEHAPGCPHRGFPRLVLLDQGQGDGGIPSVDRPRGRRVCRGLAVSTGQRCRSSALPGSGYCGRHGPARREAA